MPLDGSVSNPPLRQLRALARFLIGPFRRAKRMRLRQAIAMRYYLPKLELIRSWVKRDTEQSNFYYDLTELNRRHLAHHLASVFRVPFASVLALFDELDSDETLRTHFDTRTHSQVGRDSKILYGRRIGWYAIVRLTKPKVVIETGVDSGVGSCVLCSALLRNAAEGHPGRYYGTDLRPEAGRLLAGPYAEVGEIIYGDSIETLRSLDLTIDVFINDSDHSTDYEYREYQTVVDRLASRAVIIGDNSHGSPSLPRFSEETDRQFLFFAERPADHWYPGAGIGLSYIADAWRGPAAQGG